VDTRGTRKLPTICAKQKDTIAIESQKSLQGSNVRGKTGCNRVGIKTDNFRKKEGEKKIDGKKKQPEIHLSQSFGSRKKSGKAGGEIKNFYTNQPG